MRINTELNKLGKKVNTLRKMSLGMLAKKKKTRRHSGKKRSGKKAGKKNSTRRVRRSRHSQRAGSTVSYAYAATPVSANMLNMANPASVTPSAGSSFYKFAGSSSMI